MCGIIGFSFPEMENFPTTKVLFQLTGSQTVRAVFLAWFVEVHDGDQDASRRDAALGRLEKIPLQVVKLRDKLPSRRSNVEFVFFQIGDNGVDLQMLIHGSPSQNFDRGSCAIHSGDFPAAFRKPQSVPARSTREIKRPSRFERCRGFNQ
jgi:hypothetical protein